MSNKNLLTEGVGLMGRMELTTGGQHMSGLLPPASGTGAGATKGAPVGTIYTAITSGVQYINEGTEAAPYWTPVNFSQANLLGVYEDFRGPDPAPIGSGAVNAASGMRSFGQGIAEADSGVLKGTDVVGSNVGILRTTNEDEHTICIGMGSSVAQLAPDTHGPLVVDVLASQLTDILTRRFFCGFAGEAADAMNPIASGATTVITFSATGTEGDDMAGFFMDANLTDADGLFLPHNKADAVPTIATSATGVDISQTLAAAGTYQRFRIEMDRLGNLVAFMNKIQVGTIALALTPATVMLPVVQLAVESGTTILNMTAKQFMCWGTRS